MRVLWAVCLPLVCFAANSPTAAVQYRALWVDAFHSGYKSPAEVDQLVEDTVASHCNAIFLQVRRRADSYYLKTLEVPAQDASYSPEFDALEYLIARAHPRGIEVHAWFVVYPVWNRWQQPPPSNPTHLYHRHGPSAKGRDMWMAVSSGGATGGSLDPGHPDAQSYLVNVITDPLRHYAIDGVHLDYIRYAEDAGYGWNPVSVERFQRLTNSSPAQRPTSGDPAWNDFRRNQVTGLVRQVYLRAHELKPQVKVSAAVISWGNGPADLNDWTRSQAYARVFQDWIGWMKEGILDLAVPMHYFREASNAAYLDRWVQFAKEHQYNRRYLPGIAPYLNSTEGTLAQMRRALNPDATGTELLGLSFYSYASSDPAPHPLNQAFTRAAAAFFGGPARIPALPWLTDPAHGHLVGTLKGNGVEAWAADGVSVMARSTTDETVRATETDGTGSYGFTDLTPGWYRLTFARGGRTLFESVGEVRPGAVNRLDAVFSEAEAARVLPSVTKGWRLSHVAGEAVVVEGTNLTPSDSAEVRVYGPNGKALPLLDASPTRVIAQLPGKLLRDCTILLRHSGMDAAVILRAGKRDSS